mmetsp:Transcript_24438/g.76859  ORF Transcript_24438/g.76859 Transcript_24438/m.76859 type:complete len:211 (+) Transcript_24438:936-1568(+)
MPPGSGQRSLPLQARRQRSTGHPGPCGRPSRRAWPRRACRRSPRRWRPLWAGRSPRRWRPLWAGPQCRSSRLGPAARRRTRWRGSPAPSPRRRPPAAARRGRPRASQACGPRGPPSCLRPRSPASSSTRAGCCRGKTRSRACPRRGRRSQRPRGPRRVALGWPGHRISGGRCRARRPAPHGQQERPPASPRPCPAPRCRAPTRRRASSRP